MPQIKISVITVCLNAVETIEKAIRSVRCQSYPNVEYIIVDGESTDGTLRIVAEHADFIGKIVSEKDEGIFDAMNKGVNLAAGEIVYFLNADDHFVDDRVLSDVARAFEQDESRTLVYGNVILESGPQGVTCFPARAFKPGSISEFLHNSFCHQAVFARRSLFSRVGLFDCGYRYSADYEWIIRAFKLDAGRGFYFLDRSIAYYFFLGRSHQHQAVTRREVTRMQFRHLFSLAYLWYFLRYVFARRLKKQLLNESC